MKGAMTENILEVKDLKKQYHGKNGTVDAVKEISFHVERGEIFGFLGAKGAGKSTTINMVMTQLLLSGEQNLIDGKDLTGDAAAIWRKICVVAQNNNPGRNLTAEENLYFHSRRFGMDPKTIAQRSEELLKKFGLYDRRNDYVKNYSDVWCSVSKLRGRCSIIRRFFSSIADDGTGSQLPQYSLESGAQDEQGRNDNLPYDPLHGRG